MIMKIILLFIIFWHCDRGLTAYSNGIEKELFLLDMTMLAFSRSHSKEEANYYANLAESRFTRLEASKDSSLIERGEVRKQLFIDIHSLILESRFNFQNSVICPNISILIKTINGVDALINKKPTSYDKLSILKIRSILWKKLMKCKESLVPLIDTLDRNEVVINQRILIQNKELMAEILSANLNSKEFHRQRKALQILPDTLDLHSSISINLKNGKYPYILVLMGKNILNYIGKIHYWLKASREEIKFIFIEEGDRGHKLQDYVEEQFSIKSSNNPTVILIKNSMSNNKEGRVVLIDARGKHRLGIWPLNRLSDKGLTNEINKLISMVSASD